MQLITGNTYPVKDSIKALGGTWSKANKGWLVPDDRADEARAIVAGGGPSESYTPARSRPATSRYRSYAAASYERCTCEDYPCCGH